MLEVAKFDFDRQKPGPKSRFTESDIKHIKSKYTNGYSMRKIAKEYGVTHTTISKVIKL